MAVCACYVFNRHGRVPSEFMGLGENEKAFVIACIQHENERQGV